MTPDQVKYVLVHSADRLKRADVNAVGAGTLDIGAAYDLAEDLLKNDKNGKGAAMRAAAVQTFTQSTGQGSLDAARGGYFLVDPDGEPLTGEIDVQGNPWNAAAWLKAASTKSTWSGGNYLGATWTGAGWDATATTPRRPVGPALAGRVRGGAAPTGPAPVGRVPAGPVPAGPAPAGPTTAGAESRDRAFEGPQRPVRHAGRRRVCSVW